MSVELVVHEAAKCRDVNVACDWIPWDKKHDALREDVDGKVRVARVPCRCDLNVTAAAAEAEAEVEAETTTPAVVAAAQQQYGNSI